jgi:iron uptake system component EfeO
VVTEKEHIGPGTQARFSVSLKPGEYEIACKPGEKGSGIRQTITVA